MLIDISDVLQISVHELGRTYLRYTEALCIKIPSMGEVLKNFVGRDTTRFGFLLLLLLFIYRNIRIIRKWIHDARVAGTRINDTSTRD